MLFWLFFISYSGYLWCQSSFPQCICDQTRVLPWFHNIQSSIIGKKFKSGRFGESFLLGDSGYSNTNYFFLVLLLIPTLISDMRWGEERKINYNHNNLIWFSYIPGKLMCNWFNRSHKSTRCTIERAFGVLKKRFNVLHREIRMSLTKASWYVLFLCHMFQSYLWYTFYKNLGRGGGTEGNINTEHRPIWAFFLLWLKGFLWWLNANSNATRKMLNQITKSNFRC